MSVPVSCGTGWPVSRRTPRTRAGMSPGRRKRSSSGSMKAVKAGAASASAASVLVRGSVAAGHRARRLSWTSQSPITLRSRRIVPATPPSLVRLAARVTSDTTGAATSSPISDHVPDERNAVVGPASGAPTTADAVSWEPGATTRAPARPVSAATSGRRAPSTVPGCTISGRNPVGMPSRSSSGRAQSRVNGIQALARAGVRVLGDRAPAQEVGEQVAHHQQPVGLGGAAGRPRGPSTAAGRAC